MNPYPARSDNIMLKIAARDKAYENVFYNIYRHQMRYTPVEYMEKLGLSEGDCEEIQNFNNKEDRQLQKLRQVTVGLPEDYFDHPEWYKARAIKVMNKCYIGSCLLTFELGETENHPHYNYLFESNTKWLAKSRIIDEFSRSFQVEKNYIDVKEKNLSAWHDIEKYIKKEDIWHMKNY